MGRIRYDRIGTALSALMITACLTVAWHAFFEFILPYLEIEKTDVGLLVIGWGVSSLYGAGTLAALWGFWRWITEE